MAWGGVTRGGGQHLATFGQSQTYLRGPIQDRDVTIEETPKATLSFCPFVSFPHAAQPISFALAGV